MRRRLVYRAAVNAAAGALLGWMLATAGLPSEERRALPVLMALTAFTVTLSDRALAPRLASLDVDDARVQLHGWVLTALALLVLPGLVASPALGPLLAAHAAALYPVVRAGRRTVPGRMLGVLLVLAVLAGYAALVRPWLPQLSSVVVQVTAFYFVLGLTAALLALIWRSRPGPEQCDA